MYSNQQPVDGLKVSSAPEMLSKINAHFFPNESDIFQVFFHLKGEINIENCSDAIETIIGCNASRAEVKEDGSIVEEDRPDVINILITTSGGDMTAAISLINVIKGSRIPVRTIALGEASSAGFAILMAGHQRVVTPYSTLMSHVFSTGVEGSYHDIKNSMAELHRYNDKLTDLYHECTGLDRKVIKRKFLTHDDQFISHSDALKLNIVDLISDLG